MCEYIERGKLLKHFEAAEQIGFGIIETALVKDFILDEPPADVVEVVRCKYCRFNASSHKCLHPDSIISVPKDTDFCSYGKRRAE